MPGLAHRAAEPLLPAPRLVDEVARAGEHGADRRAEPLGEIDPGGVEAGGHLARADAGGDQAFISRAPSMWVASLLPCAIVGDLIERAFGQTVPPPILAVCSTSPGAAAACSGVRG